MTRFAKRRGIIYILSAPSGAGKTTLTNELRALYSEIKLSVSCTTRVRRRGEVNGRDYYFIGKDQFLAMRARGEFAEWAKVHDFYYGTPRGPLDRRLRAGQDTLLDIDVQGAKKIKRVYPDAVSVFLLPPSRMELERRLRLRGTDDPAVIRRRLANAQDEIRNVIQYDYYIVNRDVTEAVGVLKSIVHAERAKSSRVRAWHLETLSRRKQP
ncbi:MAG: guanylate kinase [Deltaproteobacteria bacterium]|nr:guanylate kinase [Deltaproteobacteria bacterium]